MVRFVEEGDYKEFIEHLFGAYGLSDQDAKIAADTLVEADMMGIHTHGTYRVPTYIRRIEAGSVNVKPQIKILKDLQSAVVLDGDYGLGVVVANRALDILMDRAKKNTISVVSVGRSGHFGPAGYYSRVAAKKGFVTFIFSTSTGSMFPYLGNKHLVGNNPWSIAFPYDDDPIVLDIGNSVSARGRIRQALDLGKNIPEGWALDVNGNPTVDPKKALEGSLTWIGGYKGYAISILVDLLCTMPSGAASLDESTSPLIPELKQNIGHMMIAIDLSKLGDMQQIEERMKTFRTKIKEGGDPNNKPLLPGEPESIRRKESLEKGIDLDKLPARTISELVSFAKKKGVKVPFLAE